MSNLTKVENTDDHSIEHVYDSDNGPKRCVSMSGQKRPAALPSGTIAKKAFNGKKEVSQQIMKEDKVLISAKSPYICFSLAKKNEVKRLLGPSSSDDEVTKCIARAWSILSTEDKETWIKESECDQETYEIADLIGSKPSERAAIVVDDEDKGNFKTNTTRKKSDYTIFSQKMRSVIKRKNPRMLGNTVSRMLGNIWKLLPYYERSKYSARKVNDGKVQETAILHWDEYCREVMPESNNQSISPILSRIGYHNARDEIQLAAFSNAQSAYARAANLQNSSLQLNSGIVDASTISDSYRRVLGGENLLSMISPGSVLSMQYQQQPRRPKSAYGIFCDEMCQILKATNPTMLEDEISRELGNLWMHLPDANKNIYIMQEAEKFSIYQAALTEWNIRNLNDSSRTHGGPSLSTNCFQHDRSSLYSNTGIYPNLYNSNSAQQGGLGRSLSGLNNLHREQVGYLRNNNDVSLHHLPSRHNMSQQFIAPDNIGHIQAQINAQRQLDSDYRLINGNQPSNSPQLRLLDQHFDSRDLTNPAFMRYASYPAHHPGL